VARIKPLTFGTAPNSLLNNKDISLKAKGLYAFMNSKPDNWEFSYKGLQSQLLEQKTAIKTAIKELEIFGYLIRKKYQKTNGQWGWEYQLTMVDCPSIENPSMDYPSMENIVDISKKEYSKKEISKKEREKEKENLHLSPTYVELVVEGEIDTTKIQKRYRVTYQSIRAVAVALLNRIETDTLKKPIKNYYATLNNWIGYQYPEGDGKYRESPDQEDFNKLMGIE